MCYPDRALALIQKWLAADAVQCGMVVTVKMQAPDDSLTEVDDDDRSIDDGGSDSAAAAAAVGSKGPVQQYHLQQQESVLRRLRAIPNSRLVHLQENKNEVTFMWIRPSSSNSRIAP